MHTIPNGENGYKTFAQRCSVQGSAKKRSPRFGEFCYCSCSPLLQSLACSIPTTRGPTLAKPLEGTEVAKSTLLKFVNISAGPWQNISVKECNMESTIYRNRVARLRECCRQAQAEVVRNIKTKFIKSDNQSSRCHISIAPLPAGSEREGINGDVP